MRDSQKSYILGYVMGFKEELVRTISYEVGVPTYAKLVDNSDFEAGQQNGRFDGGFAAKDVVYKDGDDFFAGTFGDDFKSGIWESMKGNGYVDPCAGPGYMQPPGFPLYLDTQLTDLCEEIKNVLSQAILSDRMRSGVVSTDILDSLYDQIDEIEQKIVMEQVDDYYGR